MPPAVAAFIGALTAGIFCFSDKKQSRLPENLPDGSFYCNYGSGTYLYRGIYNLGMMSLSVAASWFAAAILIIAALPLGLIFARILTDKTFRYCT